jgi:hypothetical protein
MAFSGPEDPVQEKINKGVRNKKSFFILLRRAYFLLRKKEEKVKPGFFNRSHNGKLSSGKLIAPAGFFTAEERRGERRER